MSAAPSVDLVIAHVALLRLICASPLFHLHGLGVAVHATFTAGGAIRILPEFDPAEVATAIAVERATLFFGVPTMFARLAESDQLTSLASLRLTVSGSAPLPVELFGRIESESGQAPIERYGMTETVMLCSNPLMGSRQAGRVGTPLPGVDVRGPIASGRARCGGGRKAGSEVGRDRGRLRCRRTPPQHDGQGPP